MKSDYETQLDEEATRAQLYDVMRAIEKTLQRLRNQASWMIWLLAVIAVWTVFG